MRHPAVALSVGAGNRAKRLYDRFGFATVASIANRIGTPSYVMQADLRQIQCARTDLLRLSLSERSSAQEGRPDLVSEDGHRVDRTAENADTASPTVERFSYQLINAASAKLSNVIFALCTLFAPASAPAACC
jgi:hypothetical protein